ncbi:MAG TPA: cupin domain-containing protein [Gaiellaceae bacterium]|nr:cupin domain-containing protein [Gaiellaceae bacterium]
MVEQARLVETESGFAPEGDGWFVVNAREAAWWRQRDVFGYVCRFEGDAAFPELGINLRVLRPGEPNCRYHAQSTQEDFLVLHGECLLLVEGEERRLRAWDFVHCPPGTAHVFVGAGDGPCVILMAGSRKDDEQGWVVYPVSELALNHGAGARSEAHDPQEAYADLPASRRERPPDLGLPWQ